MNIIEIYKLFPTEKDCIKHLETVRWKGKPTCPYCKSLNSTSIPAEPRHHCNNCNTSYSVTVATIFHHTHLPLQKWFLAISLILNAKKGISSRQLGRDIQVTKDTAWSMQMRIRDAMIEQGELFSGIVEMDETYIGGKPRKGNKRDDDVDGGNKSKRGRGTDKTPVVGMVERGGRVKAKVQDKSKLKFKDLRRIVKENIDMEKCRLITDEYKGYLPFGKIMKHDTINHQQAYAIGDINTNSIESFWALLKRGIVGQYHQVSVHYLNRYINEFCFRYNHRKNPNVFNLMISRAVGA